MPARRRHHCRAPNKSVPCPTGMPPRSAAPATPPSGVGSPRTRATVVDRGPTREPQTGTRTSGLEPRKDRSPRSRTRLCCGTGQDFGPTGAGNLAAERAGPRSTQSYTNSFNGMSKDNALWGADLVAALSIADKGVDPLTRLRLLGSNMRSVAMTAAPKERLNCLLRSLQNRTDVLHVLPTRACLHQ
jgi:hypothetical protein